MTTGELLTFLVSSGALAAGLRSAYNSGKVVQKLDDHIAADDRRFHEHDEDIKRLENRLWVRNK